MWPRMENHRLICKGSLVRIPVRTNTHMFAWKICGKKKWRKKRETGLVKREKKKKEKEAKRRRRLRKNERREECRRKL